MPPSQAYCASNCRNLICIRKLLLTIFVFQLGTRATDAHTKDVVILHYDSVRYLVPFRDHEFPSSTLHEKRKRGFGNIVTGRMLCPQQRLDEVDVDPDE